MGRNYSNFGSPSRRGRLVVNAGKLFEGIEFYDINSNKFKFSYGKGQEFIEKIIPNGEDVIRFYPNGNKKFFEVPKEKVEQLKKIILEAEELNGKNSLVFHREF